MRQALAIAFVVAFAGPAATDPQLDYMLQCQGCHLSDGTGTPGAVPSFVDFVGTFLAIPGGREFLVRVPGSSQSELDDARLAAVLNWILARFDSGSQGDGFVPFTAEEVARVRRPPLTDVEAVRRELLSRVDAAPRRPTR